MLASRLVVPSIVVLLAFAAPAHSQVLTVTGGSISASTQAGQTGLTVNSDNPSPVAVQPGALSSLSAASNGTANCSELPCDSGIGIGMPTTVSTTANASVDATQVNDITLNASTTATLNHHGPGSWCCGTAMAMDTVFFSLSSPTQVSLVLNNGSQFEAGVVTDMTTGARVPLGTDMLAADQYEAVLQSFGPGFIVGSGTTTSLTSGSLAIQVTPAPVPVPGTVWLLGSALLGFAALKRRRGAHSYKAL